MAEGGGGGTRVLNDGGRQRFQVELRPGETTIVSWKKLVKDANRASASVSAAAKPKEQPPVPKPPVLNPRVDPVNHSRLFHFISQTCFSDYVFFYCSQTTFNVLFRLVLRISGLMSVGVSSELWQRN